MGFKEDVQNLHRLEASFFKALAAEFIGTMLLNFFGCLSIPYSSDLPVQIALAFGFIVFIVVQTVGHVSGGHINPAVTAGMLVTGNISLFKAILYIMMQILGATWGSLCVKLLNGTSVGVTALNSELSPFRGLGIEFLLGFILVFTVFGVVDVNNRDIKPTAALAIGTSVTTGHLAALLLTGSSMNPARSFGAAVIAWSWASHWIYWIGPIVGGITAGLLYKYVLTPEPRNDW